MTSKGFSYIFFIFVSMKWAFYREGGRERAREGGGREGGSIRREIFIYMEGGI